MKVKLRKIKKSEAAVPAERVEITSPFIKLDALLKFAMLAETGGEAKLMVQDGEVSVNRETCTQRGRKIYPGDLVQAGGKRITVFRADSSDGNDR